jgi:hypothetical protein
VLLALEPLNDLLLVLLALLPNGRLVLLGLHRKPHRKPRLPRAALRLLVQLMRLRRLVRLPVVPLLLVV